MFFIKAGHGRSNVNILLYFSARNLICQYIFIGFLENNFYKGIFCGGFRNEREI